MTELKLNLKKKSDFFIENKKIQKKYTNNIQQK